MELFCILKDYVAITYSSRCIVMENIQAPAPMVFQGGAPDDPRIPLPVVSAPYSPTSVMSKIVNGKVKDVGSYVCSAWCGVGEVKCAGYCSVDGGCSTDGNLIKVDIYFLMLCFVSFFVC